ncbi:COX15/CtaA family protein [Roseateles amylovorans]|uniref:COX15/CtaA family protein n=1 Tax=Roseateles amylovorans TaxID=2978473 RepID=A0ABY6AWX0_9BURK|nr:COX15/CtaA family protein [Roseateles amylovorans]UXH77671.1 COX15/CtaA family protein [Roseateles amylovorans]
MTGLANGFDFGPLLQLLAMAALIGGAALLWWHLRQRSATPSQRLRALTVLTVFLTFDLILVGSFTRLTDSGLGCPDWPGCYGSASPLGARDEIHAAQSAMPTGPVTHGKAWVEMIHRYLASGVGFLILVLAIQSWRLRLAARRAARAGAAADDRLAGGTVPSPWWSTLSLVWVLVQGLFGAWTVTMKLFPAIVTSHLLLALGLLMLLAWQAEAYAPRPLRASHALRRGMVAFTALVIVQVALGGWVSTNYAVLACRDFPTCQGQWWPATDFEHGFTLWRELGRGAHGDWLPFEALTAIHLTHRIGALIVFVALLAMAAALWRLDGGAPGQARVASPAIGATEGIGRPVRTGRTGMSEGRRWALRLLAVGGWQAATGLSNVVLGWPLVAAVSHTGGAAALLLICSLVLARLRAGALTVSSR